MIRISTIDTVRTSLGGTGKLLPVAILITCAFAAFWLFPYDLGFMTQMLIMMVFVVSFDLILGYAGIATLGHAAMYGCGAYAAGLFAIHASPDPLLGLAVGAVIGALIAFFSGLLLMRAHGLSLLMLSIAITMVLQEIASKARDVTGGADGLTGISMTPILGVFEFDFIGKTAFWYAFSVLFVILVVLRILVASPFGLALRGIKDSPSRMRAIGTPVYWRKVTAYVIGGTIAGIAGALSAQITSLVSVEAFNFALSADVMVMLILGGAGRLYGALIGTLVFMTVRHVAASIDPFNWLFVIGFMLLAVVFFLPDGLISLPRRVARMIGARR
ncbi:branched-chain amino acid transport system permease protein [Mesorhizobium robiniae]|uniref:Branched-chain amino acid transport system permease protein n=1 Tax=Mesorhizobium robiniae TaxID=559315 RepID=A0ABV2GXC6_9HYPH|nr:branched-chain amino acid ABC transporter permease [Mesorhizobium sp. ZC-5]MCV3241984.1 branched-chain amino acid ABC transporter permease [Mesorhizobium sp. ZC-5]